MGNGETVLYRYGRQGQARFVRVGRVIRDDADGLALWIGPGTPLVESVLPDGRGLLGWTVEQAPRIRATGEHLMALATSGAPPFDGR